MKTFSGRPPSQHPDELASFIALLRREKVTRYLEIGARHGDTFHAVMSALPQGSAGVAVDLPGGAWGQPRTEGALRQAVRDVIRRGCAATMLLGDSTALPMIETVASLGPFDAVLIDGDHRYDGVLADWENYGRPPSRIGARLVAFHDIAGEGQMQRTSGLAVEVPRLWRELAPHFTHAEFVAPGSAMGIGVLWK